MTCPRDAVAAALLALAVAGGPLAAAPAAAAPGLTVPAKAAALPKTVGYRITTAELHLWKASGGKAYARIIRKGSMSDMSPSSPIMAMIIMGSI